MRAQLREQLKDLAVIIWLLAGAFVGIATFIYTVSDHPNCVEVNQAYLRGKGLYYVVTDSTHVFYILD